MHGLSMSVSNRSTKVKKNPVQDSSNSHQKKLFGFFHYRYFEKVREKEPYRDSMMEIYSTALWHLHKEKDLSSLAHDLLQCDRYSPSTWCVAGNCVSLHKEHDVAIKFFERAVQVRIIFCI